MKPIFEKKITPVGFKAKPKAPPKPKAQPKPKAPPTKKKAPPDPERLLRIVQGSDVDGDTAAISINAQIRRMAGLGLPERDMCVILGINGTTLTEKYQADLDIGRAQANLTIANSLWQTANDRTHTKHATCAIFWAKSRLGWKDGNEGPDGRTEEIPDGASVDEQESDEVVALRFDDMMQRLAK